MLTMMINIFNVFKYGLTGLFLFLDALTYWLVSTLFSLYEELAAVRFITQGDYQQIVARFSAIIGVVMLFYLTYGLLKSLVNPDELNKNVGKVATNFVISLVLLGVAPVLFNYAFELQDAIIEDNVISTLVLGSENAGVSNAGTEASFMILNTFVNPEHANIVGESGQEWQDFQDSFQGSGNGEKFLDLTDFAEAIHEGESGVTYKPIISTACGLFMVYILVSFCIDLGIRVFKLAFYQIIAPIPILMRVMPEKKSVFDNWVKGTIATYLEVFIRLFVMFVIILLVQFVLAHVTFSKTGFLGNVILILGLFAFAKQAPKLISNVIGVDAGNIKLGIGGKLAAAGAFGNAINNFGKGALGAVTGGLGGAYGALVNGASAGAGFKYGMANGWKGKKNQFNRQRQDIYSNVLGQKGTASWFGGESFSSSNKTKNKANIQKSYLESEKSKIERIENSQAFKNKENEIRSKVQKENNQKYSELSKQLSQMLKEFSSQRENKIKEYKNQMKEEKETFEKDKMKKIKDLQIELEAACNSYDITKQNQLMTKLEEVKNSTYSNPELMNLIDTERNKTSNKEIDGVVAQMNSLRTIDNDAIFKAAQKEFMKDNANYKSSYKYVAQKNAEKAAREWREANPTEAAIQESLYENAFRNVSKDGGGPKPPTPSSGSSADASKSSK